MYRHLGTLWILEDFHTQLAKAIHLLYNVTKKSAM